MTVGAASARVRELLGADLRRAAAEAAVGGLEVLRDPQRGARGVKAGPPRGVVDLSAQARGEACAVAPRWSFHLFTPVRDGGRRSLASRK